jgi:hyperosmotically inducible periplasmic protein
MTRYLSLLLALCLVIGCMVGAFGQKSTAKPDDLIYDQVRLKLASNAEVKGGAIDVEVKDGVVTLHGKVRTDRAKHKAETVAAKVKGVKKVINDLTVNPI